jgi:RNA polymerase sigma factor
MDLARRGDREARDLLIAQYTPFVLRVASGLARRYLNPGQDDEVSIALMAFNEAIDGYDRVKGTSFLSFAEMVIKRRLIDHFRRNSQNREVPMTDFEEEDAEGNVVNPVQVRQAMMAYSAHNEASDRREEIRRYQSILAQYRISFSELVDLSPKHDDARERAIEAARQVAARPQLRDHLTTKKELPLKELGGLVNVSRKTLERQRKYIIAVALILIEDFTHLRHYIRQG